MYDEDATGMAQYTADGSAASLGAMDGEAVRADVSGKADARSSPIPYESFRHQARLRLLLRICFIHTTYDVLTAENA